VSFVTRILYPSQKNKKKKTKINRRNRCVKSYNVVIKRKKGKKRNFFSTHHTKERCVFGSFLAQKVKQPSALSQNPHEKSYKSFSGGVYYMLLEGIV